MLIERVLLGAVALHISRILVVLVDSLRLVLPGYWLYGAIALILGLCFAAATRLPNGFLDGLRYRNRYQIVYASAIAGMILGLGGV